MSEESQATAIGHAIQAAAAARKQKAILAAEIDRAAESFKIAHEALRELLGDSPAKGHDVYKALKAIPDVQRLRELVSEYPNAATRLAELAERARELSSL